MIRTLERVYERLAKAKKPKRRTISKVQRVKRKATTSLSAAQEKELVSILNNDNMKATKRLQLFTNRIKQIDG
jgi:predicted nucleotidyltransferase